MTGGGEQQLDLRVRAAVYEGVIASGLPPRVHELARHLELPALEVVQSLERLAGARALVLQRGSGEVLMASPFSAVPTAFAVRVCDRLYYGNCIWDALGIPAMIDCGARIEASCGCCGEAMRLTVRGGELVEQDGVVHFAVPMRRWWDDIVFN